MHVLVNSNPKRDPRHHSLDNLGDPMLLKILSILGAGAKKQLVFLLSLMVVGSILEVMGIALILPFIQVVSNPGNIELTPWLRHLHAFFGEPSHQTFVMLLGVLLLAVYAAKNLFLLLISYLQNRFIYRKQTEVSHRLLSCYLYSPYSFHLSRNSSALIRNLTVSMGTIFGSGIIPFLQILSEAPVVLAISAFLLAVQPVETLVCVVVVAVLSAVFYRFVRNRVALYGERVQESSNQMILWATQSVEGVKEMKLLGCEPYFLKHFYTHRVENSDANILFSLIQRIPALFLEVILIGAMVLVMVVTIGRGGDLLNVIPTIGLFSVAAMRLLPSVNRISSSLNAMRFGSAALDDIHRELIRFTDPILPRDGAPIDIPMEPPQEIEARNLAFSYPGADAPVFSGVSFRLHRGSLVAFAGSSGAGKTTLANIFMGLLKPDQGDLFVDGKAIHADAASTTKWQRSIGHVPQESYLIDDTLKHNIALGVNNEGISNEHLNAAIRQAGLVEFIQELPGGFDARIGQRGIRLSGGQRQRINIARALYHNPAVLLMDEATSAVDNETESRIAEAIQSLKKDRVVIVIAHRLSTIQACDCIYFLRGGRIADAGTYTELVNRNEEFRTMVQHQSEPDIRQDGGEA